MKINIYKIPWHYFKTDFENVARRILLTSKYFHTSCIWCYCFIFSDSKPDILDTIFSVEGYEHISHEIPD